MNVVKHARASRAVLTLRETPDGIEMRVADDGVGFDPAVEATGGTAGFGLFSIRERMPYLGGELEIDSAPGRGTRAILRTPWDN